MYLYIYDSFLSHQKYDSFLTAVERRVTDLGINGKIARLTILKNTKELVADAVKSGISTVVSIGDDQTFAKIINIIADFNVTLGLIPVDGSSKIARVLGIPPRELACDVLAARIVKKIDLGKINNYYFLSSALIKNAQVQIACDGYSLAPMTEANTVQIFNISVHNPSSHSNPTDGKLEAVITPMESGWFAKKELQPTIVPFTKLRINAMGDEPVSILTDEQIVLKTPADIEIAPQKLKIIVGSNRSFE